MTTNETIRQHGASIVRTAKKLEIIFNIRQRKNLNLELATTQSQIRHSICAVKEMY